MAFQFQHTNLEWQTWNGSIPAGAVSIYNEYEKRTDYVAKYGQEAGFYCPTMDQYCHYPYGDKEYCESSFEILVNKDNFEVLEWKSGSYGSVPENAVKTYPDSSTYVGKSKYGLGKVHPGHEAFFYPWRGKEYWSKYYEVLTFNRDIIREDIVDVQYNTYGVQILQYLPQIISNTTVTNRGCQPAKQTTTLSETIAEEESWSTNSSVKAGVETSFTAGVPSIASATIGFSAEVSFGFTNGATCTKSKSRTVSVEHQVPPNHSCSVRMEARMHSANIPFTARLKRTYRNGKSTWTSITGTYRGVQLAEVQAVLDPCKPLN